MGWTKTHVVHDELVGGAAADLPDSWSGLYGLAGLDPREWLVVALELSGSYRSTRASLLAVPQPPEGLFVRWPEVLAERGGRLEVRRFPVPGGAVPDEAEGALAVLAELKRWSVRLAVHPLGEAELDVLVDTAT